MCLRVFERPVYSAIYPPPPSKMQILKENLKKKALPEMLRFALFLQGNSKFTHQGLFTGLGG